METIKKLRDMTGAGITACQKALAESNNDLEKAVEILRKQGIAKASKRSENEAREGIVKVLVSEDQKKGWILQMNCETDFVAKNEKFQNFADKLLKLAEANNLTSLDELLKTKMEDNWSVQESVDSLSGVIGEKITLSAFAGLASQGAIGSYSHANDRLGVLVSLDKADDATLANNIAIQVAASNPKYITPNEIPTEEKQKEEEIYREQLKKENKPENILTKIIEGKLNKYFEEICLIKQEYIKDDKQKVENILKDAQVEKFIRYSL